MATRTAVSKTTPTQSGLRIIKKGTCGLIAPSSTGELTYNIGFDAKDKTFHFRVIGNSGGGYHSREWVSLDAILEHIEAQPPGQPFKSLILRKVYVSTGANNYGFLAAVLRAEGILVPVPKKPFSHLAGDVAAFRKAMQSLLKTDLEDEVALEEAAKAHLREERAAAMQKILAKKGRPMQTASEAAPTTPPTQPARKAPRKSAAKSA
jgi:hypothetical protein